MGLFSSKKKYFAYAASQSIIEEPVNTVQSELLKNSIADEPFGVSETMRMSLETDYYARARAMYRYAAKDSNGYIRGFPESNMNLIAVDPVQVEAALGRAVGAFDSVVSAISGGIREAFILSRELQAVYENTSYFPWGTPPSANWSEERATVQIPVINPDTGAYYEVDNSPDYIKQVRFELDREDIPPEEWVTRSYVDLFEGKYDVAFDYIDNTGAEAVYVMNGSLDVQDYIESSKKYVQVRYLVGGQTRYWLYEIDSGIDPTFEQFLDQEERDGEYMPVAVLMQDQVWFDEVMDSPLEKTTNKLVKKLGTTGTKIREDFQEQEADNSNKDNKAKKWDFFVHFAVPIRTNRRGSKEYLYYYFQTLQDWQTYSYQDYYDYLANPSRAQPVSQLEIKEAGVNGYNVNYRWSYIHTKEYTGDYLIEDTITVPEDPDAPPEDIVLVEQTIERPLKFGEVDIEIWERSDEPGVQEPGYQEALDDIFGPGTPQGPWSDDDEETGYHDIIVITRSHKRDPDNPEARSYSRTIIMGLSMQYIINTKDTEHSTGKKGYNFRYATPQLFGLEEETKEFRIPIHIGSLKQVPRLHREEALQDGLTGTVFLVEIQKVKWYQTGFFKWLIIIIAVVLVVLSIVFPGFLYAAAWMITAALGLGATAFMVILTLLSFAMGMIISLASGLIGGTAGKIFAIVAAIAMIYSAQAMNGGGLSQSWQSFTQNPGWATAGTFLTTIKPYYDIGFGVYRDYKLGQLQDEAEKALKDHKEEMEKLEEMYAGMTVVDGVDPLDLISVYHNQGAYEMSDAYLSRVLETNPGQQAIEYVYNFPEAAIMLPKDIGQPSIIDGVFSDLAQQRGAT
jgi:hypothetical protein